MDAREKKLMPGGDPKWVRCYDAPECGDRYTVVFTGRYRRAPLDGYPYLAMSEDPFNPQGIGQHGEGRDGPIDVNGGGFAPAMGRKCHLGRRIPFGDLPEKCRSLAKRTYRELWGL